MEKNNNALFFTCSLIEYISRVTNNRRSDIINYLGSDLKRIYDYADVFHCEPIEKVADDFIVRNNIINGEYDNISKCKYAVPDYWDIGEVYERLIEDSYDDEDIVNGIWAVYHSWIDSHISYYNSDFYYQPRDYIAACFEEGDVL